MLALELELVLLNFQKFENFGPQNAQNMNIASFISIFFKCERKFFDTQHKTVNETYLFKNKIEFLFDKELINYCE